jgi:ribonuclease VapC
MAHVLDAFALTAYFEKEPGYEKVQELLTAAATSNRRLFLSAVNWGEVYYVTYRAYGPEQAEKVARILETFPIDVVPVDIVVARQAALFKASHKLSYADCFAGALAKMKRAVLVTGDKEFKSLEEQIKVFWLE